MKEKETDTERTERERGREFEHVWKKLFNLHPRFPGEAFHANPFAGVGYGLTQWKNTNTHTHQALDLLHL